MLALTKFEEYQVENQQRASEQTSTGPLSGLNRSHEEILVEVVESYQSEEEHHEDDHHKDREDSFAVLGKGNQDVSENLVVVLEGYKGPQPLNLRIFLTATSCRRWHSQKRFPQEW